MASSTMYVFLLGLVLLAAAVGAQSSGGRTKESKLEQLVANLASALAGSQKEEHYRVSARDQQLAEMLKREKRDADAGTAPVEDQRQFLAEESAKIPQNKKDYLMEQFVKGQAAEAKLGGIAAILEKISKLPLEQLKKIAMSPILVADSGSVRSSKLEDAVITRRSLAVVDSSVPASTRVSDMKKDHYLRIISKKLHKVPFEVIDDLSVRPLEIVDATSKESSAEESLGSSKSPLLGSDSWFWIVKDEGLSTAGDESQAIASDGALKSLVKILVSEQMKAQMNGEAPIYDGEESKRSQLKALLKKLQKDEALPLPAKESPIPFAALPLDQWGAEESKVKKAHSAHEKESAIPFAALPLDQWGAEESKKDLLHKILNELKSKSADKKESAWLGGHHASEADIEEILRLAGYHSEESKKDLLHKILNDFKSKSADKKESAWLGGHHASEADIEEILRLAGYHSEESGKNLAERIVKLARAQAKQAEDDKISSIVHGLSKALREGESLESAVGPKFLAALQGRSAN